MSNTSLDISKRIDPLQRDLLVAAFGVASRIGIQPIVVGATARDLILDFGYGIRPARATTDVDLALSVAAWDRYDEFREALLDLEEFEPGREPHRLVFRKALSLDLLPFGGIEDADGNIRWPSASTTLSMLGYKEIGDRAISVRIDESNSIRVVNLADLAMLKLLAWNERRHLGHPRKDAEDFSLIARHYVDAGNQDGLYETHADLVDEEDFDYATASARMLGRDSRAQASESLRGAVLKVLSEGLSRTKDCPLVRAMGGAFDAALALASAFQSGMTDGS